MACSLPDSKVHGANMGPPGSCRSQVSPMLAPWTLLSGLSWTNVDQVVWRHMTSLGLNDFDIIQPGLFKTYVDIPAKSVEYHKHNSSMMQCIAGSRHR